MWTIDSGCTRHVTHEAQWFSDISASGGSITVRQLEDANPSWSALRSEVAVQPLIGSGCSEA
ncbi:Polyprotein [Phytophthora palmivora]|uniref:Polyprotein n=1 Tax=Phytophthora palmivora TaxID=4796 RepID=A0A2P4Y7L5_9STRA|nr:Polyprotein [Phytophthora palmivora]